MRHSSSSSTSTTTTITIKNTSTNGSIKNRGMITAAACRLVALHRHKQLHSTQHPSSHRRQLFKPTKALHLQKPQSVRCYSPAHPTSSFVVPCFFS